ADEDEGAGGGLDHQVGVAAGEDGLAGLAAPAPGPALGGAGLALARRREGARRPGPSGPRRPGEQPGVGHRGRVARGPEQLLGDRLLAGEPGEDADGRAGRRGHRCPSAWSGSSPGAIRWIRSVIVWWIRRGSSAPSTTR